MNHRKPRERRFHATQQRILETAMTLVRETGLSGLSIHGLARALDYTPGALYRYFSSKEALIAALTVHILWRFGDVASRVRHRLDAAALPGHDLAGSERWRFAAGLATVLVYRDLARAAPGEFGVLALIIADPNVLVPDVTEAAPVMTSIHAEVAPIAVGLEAAGVAHPELRALALFGALHGQLVMRKQAPRVPHLDLDEMLADTVRALCVGWGVDPVMYDDEMRAITALGDLVEFAGGMP